MKKAIVSLALVGALFSAAQASGQGASVVMINPNVDSHLDGKVTPLALKSEVPLKATVVSSEVGNAQLMLDDSSLISIAPSSEISLLEYVDEPGDESIAVSMATGSARFVTGEINRKNPKAFVVNTPNSTIGIRGTIVSISCDGDNTRVYLTQTSGAGVTITNKSTGQTTDLTKPGNIVIISSSGIEQRAGTKAEADALVANFNGSAAQKTTTNAQNGAGTTQNSSFLLASNAAADTTNSASVIENDAQKQAGNDPVPPTPDPDPTPVPPTPEAFDKNKVQGTFNGKGWNSTISFDVELNTAKIANGYFKISDGGGGDIVGRNGSGDIKDSGELDIDFQPGDQLKTAYEIDGMFDSLSSGTYSLYQETGNSDVLADMGVFTNFALDPKNIEGTFNGKGDFSTLDFIVELSSAAAREISFTFDNKEGFSVAGINGRANITEQGMFDATSFVDKVSGGDLRGAEVRGAFGSLNDGSYILSVTQDGANSPLTDAGKFSKK